MRYPQYLSQLIDALRRLPGVGTKSAERFAFYLLSAPSPHRQELARVINAIDERLLFCQECGSLTEGASSDSGCCSVCTDSRRNQQQLCIVAYPKDIFAIEDTKTFSGLFHVLGTLLSPIDGRLPDKEGIDRLLRRIAEKQIHEVIIALDSTLEGDATALFLKKELAPFNVAISRLAFGLPMGSSLDYVDGGTLARAFSGRRTF